MRMLCHDCGRNKNKMLSSVFLLEIYVHLSSVIKIIILFIITFLSSRLGGGWVENNEVLMV